MGRSAGAGSPVFFRCAKCRSTLNPDRRKGSVTRVELTSKQRPRRHTKGHAKGSRSSSIEREYRCLDCGHVGWSSHTDLQHKADKKEDDA